jgi:hypothetical protein
MPEMKLPKLPDRAPVKMSISLQPELNRRLLAYAECYRDIYGEAESVAELIPYMLEMFIKSDRVFVKRPKQ